MDKEFKNSFGRIVRVVASKDGAFLQIRSDHKELGSAALTSDELQQLFRLISEATSILD